MGLIKLLGGFEYDEFINNTPKDGIVDRAQIAHYPSGAVKNSNTYRSLS